MARKRRPVRIPRGLPGAGRFSTREEIRSLRDQVYYERHPEEFEELPPLVPIAPLEKPSLTPAGAVRRPPADKFERWTAEIADALVADGFPVSLVSATERKDYFGTWRKFAFEFREPIGGAHPDLLFHDLNIIGEVINAGLKDKINGRALLAVRVENIANRRARRPGDGPDEGWAMIGVAMSNIENVLLNFEYRGGQFDRFLQRYLQVLAGEPPRVTGLVLHIDRNPVLDYNVDYFEADE